MDWLALENKNNSGEGKPVADIFQTLRDKLAPVISY